MIPSDRGIACPEFATPGEYVVPESTGEWGRRHYPEPPAVAGLPRKALMQIPCVVADVKMSATRLATGIE